MTTHVPVPADIPTDIRGLTPAWITQLLRSHGHDVEIDDVTAEPIGTGQMASSYRLHLRYCAPTPLPGTMVAKLATGPEAQREFGSGAFRNEVRFYRELAHTFRVPVPRCHAALSSASGAEFVLLLEDIAEAAQGDQIAGCSASRVRDVAIAAAGLHGPRWNDAGLLADYPLPTDEDRALMESVTEPMADVFRSRFELTALESATVDWLVRDAGAWLIAPIEHFALIHGDLRVDNVLFGPDDAVTVIDWQTITTGHPMRDIAFLVSTSLTTDDRRINERAIVADYHRALTDFGVDSSAYGLDQCWQDYVTSLIQAPLIIVFGCAAAQPTERGDAMFRVMLQRAAAAVDDLNPGALR
ncbi:phosphotransferase family protein [Gordonia sp. NPDC003429]